jgi:hypothetical protein
MLSLFKAIFSPNINNGNPNKHYRHNSLETSSGSVDPKTVIAFDISERSDYKRYQDSLLTLTKLNLLERENGY